MDAVATTSGEGERKVIYLDGVFDLTHVGHVRLFRNTKELFPNAYLKVGVTNDADTHSKKGPTVLTEEERYEMVGSCRWVDEVIRDAPWIITLDFLKAHEIDFVAHDPAPYPSPDGSIPDIYAPIKEAGKFIATQRTEGISTSDLIERILVQYDRYVLRNYERGVPLKKMKVGLLKSQEIMAKKQIKDFKKKGRELIGALEEEPLYKHSKRAIRGFLKFFAGANEGTDTATTESDEAEGGGRGDDDEQSPVAKRQRRR